MDLASDIARIAAQEKRLQLAKFDESVAWTLGMRLKVAAESLPLPLAIEIRLARETVFFHAMSGTSPVNADWARRKRNTVELLHRSSYGVGRSLEQEGSSLEAKLGLPTRDYASHGGSFPLRLLNGACAGVVTVSGAPQRQDHAMVVEMLAAWCGVPLAEVALE